MRLQAAIRSDCSWVDVIDKHHAMPHEHAIADGDAFADERMAGDFAIASHNGASLDLDKCPHFGAIPDGASVQVHEIGLDDPYAGSELNVVGNQIWFLTSRQLFRMTISNRIWGSQSWLRRTFLGPARADLKAGCRQPCPPHTANLTVTQICEPQYARDLR